jgi:hypothetical protein
MSYENSIVKAYGNSTVDAFGGNIEAYENSTIRVYFKSTNIKKVSKKSNIVYM